MRLSRLMLAAVFAALLGACSSVSGVGEATSGSSPAATAAEDLRSSESSPEPTAEYVEVAVSRLTGARGGTLVAIVFGTSSSNGLGGFAVRVDGDPFATTQTVNEPGRPGEGLFPYVTTSPLILEPGHYVLTLWVAPQDLGPYARWIPSDISGLLGCSTPFDVGPNGGAAVHVTNVPAWKGAPQGCELP